MESIYQEKQSESCEKRDTAEDAPGQTYKKS